MPSFSVDGRVYKAKLKRVGRTHTIVATCWGEDDLGNGKCSGNSYGTTPCWHVLARILAGANGKVKFYSTETGAQKSGKEIWRVVSSQGRGVEIWVTM